MTDRELLCYIVGTLENFKKPTSDLNQLVELIHQQILKDEEVEEKQAILFPDGYRLFDPHRD